MSSLTRRGIALPYVLLLATPSNAACRSNKGTVALANESSHPIPTASVTVCGQRFEATDLAVGKVVSFAFKVSCEGGFRLDLRRNTAHTASEYLGYVSPGFDYKYRFNIKDGSIEPVVEVIDCWKDASRCA